jgi:hypothetical protein
MNSKLVFPLFFLATLILQSCSHDSNTKLVREYYACLNDHKPERALNFLSEDIIVSEFDFSQVRNRDQWQVQFAWDKTFLPAYEILEIHAVNDQVEAIVSKSDKRIRYLHDSPVVYKVKFAFSGSKIKSEHLYDYLEFNLDRWQTRRDSLVSWIEKNHPELSGFIHDQTTTGAEKYLKAIELYETK